jgi:hypothetical protein
MNTSIKNIDTAFSALNLTLPQKTATFTKKKKKKGKRTSFSF